MLMICQLRVGMSIGHSPEQPQLQSDMRKKEENVTMEERQEAKRRIEGSLAPAAVPIRSCQREMNDVNVLFGVMMTWLG